MGHRCECGRRSIWRAPAVAVAANMAPEKVVEFVLGRRCFVSRARVTTLVLAALLLVTLVPQASALLYTKDVKCVSSAGTAAGGNVGAGGGDLSPDDGSGDVTAGSSEPRIRRLDPRVRPQLYRLTMRPFLGEGANFTFHGRVAITLSIEPAARGDVIVLHSKQLNISAEQVSITLDQTKVKSRTRRASSTMQAPPVPRVVSQRANPEDETYTITLAPPLQPGYNYVLSIPFIGQLLEDTLAGFFRTSYVEGGHTKWVALTHFEATEARRAFPCFDEPALKARFQISMEHLANYNAISNMPIVRSEKLRDEAGWVVDHFDTSPPMSTYLVAFTVAEMVFETANESLPAQPARGPCTATAAGTEGGSGETAAPHTSSSKRREGKSQASPRITDPHLRIATSTAAAVIGDRSSVRIRILVQPDLREQAKYALTIAPKLLCFYGNYFGTPYPLPKLDFTAIPNFLYNGMENWGAVTFWQDRVLVNPETTSDNLQRSAITIVHEFGHQWIGDLVTPTWWSETWLREGFATYLEYLATNFVEPTWEMTDKFLNAMHQIMDQDSTQFTRPVFSVVETNTQLIQAFDAISYTKGACLFRMLNHSLTEPVFQKGMVILINYWKYSNANHDDLWWSMEQAVKQMVLHEHALPPNTTVRQMMDSWTLQPGFPVITAIRNYATGSVTINQTRFTIDGHPVANSSSQAWYVPLSYTTQDELRGGRVSTAPREWLGISEGQRTITIDGILPPGTTGATKWLLINLEQTGYYKVNYDLPNWELLVHQLVTRPLLLPSASRAQLISDALSLARAGSLPYGYALNVTRYLRDSRAEVSLVPWQAFLDGIQFLELGLRVTDTYFPLKRYLLSLLVPLIDHLHMDPQPGDALTTKQLRAHILSRAIWLEGQGVIQWSQRLFRQWMASPSNNSIPADLRSVVYCAALMQGSDTDFNFVLAQLRNTTDTYQRSDLLSGLMCTQQPTLIVMLLNAPLEGKIMNIQDAPTVWKAVPRNPAAHTIAFDYIREQWSNLINRFPDTDYPINDMLEGATSGLSTQQQLDDLKAFHESHEGQFNLTSTTIERAIDSLQEVVSWRRRFETDIAEWFSSPVVTLL